MPPKYANMKWIDSRTNLKMVVYSYYLQGKQTQYWVAFYRPKGKTILRKEKFFESTLTKLKPYLKEIK